MILDEILRARARLEPPGRALGGHAPHGGESPSRRALDSAMAYIANLVASRVNGQAVRFREVTEAADWRRVRELRLRSYPVSLPYLLATLRPDGSDRYDRHSLVYAAFLGDRAVATIRATPYPYEILNYVREDVVAGYLGRGWRSDYIEWGRLLVDHEFQRLRLTPALITYAGLRLLTLSPYRSYFGYTRPHVRGLVSRFAVEQDTLRFKIPDRGDHEYLITKGSLGAGAVRELPRWLRRASARLARTPPRSAPPRAAMAHAVAP
jgi:hypothetical protein